MLNEVDHHTKIWTVKCHTAETKQCDRAKIIMEITNILVELYERPPCHWSQVVLEWIALSCLKWVSGVYVKSFWQLTATSLLHLSQVNLVPLSHVSYCWLWFNICYPLEVSARNQSKMKMKVGLTSWLLDYGRKHKIPSVICPWNSLWAL